MIVLVVAPSRSSSGFPADFLLLVVWRLAGSYRGNKSYDQFGHNSEVAKNEWKSEKNVGN